MTALTYHDVTAEQRALGVYMLRPDLLLKAGLNLADMDELRGHHAILSALQDQAERGIPGSFQLLVAELTAKGLLNRLGDEHHRGQAYLFYLRDLGQQSIPQDADVARQSIRQASIRRQLAEVGTRLVQVSEQPDPDDMLSNAAELSLALDLAVNDNGLDADRPLPGLRSVPELLAMPDRPTDWLVPGLLGRQERVVFIGPEGHGKSVLSRQVAVCVAAGLHPFLPRVHRYPFAPHRTLLVDLENPPGMVRRDLARQLRPLGGQDIVADRMHVWNWPAGLDLRAPSGRSLLVRAIEQTKPDLLCIGPLYKMADARSSESYEEQAQRLSKALDGLRQRYDLTLWIEHHMPNPDQEGRRTRPFGSSLWSRWPEFGPRMDMPTRQEPGVYRLGRFRGDREVRQWPDGIVRDTGGRLLWAGMWDDEETERQIEWMLTHPGQ
jgi:hypothetical protein